ncbi:DUF3006 domain-containing protein [Anaerovirgula multivorans]
MIPSSSKEGDVLVFEDGKYIVDELLTLNRQREIKKKFGRLWK